MSDYLKALTERTLGVAAVVRPVISPTFAAPVSGADKPEPPWGETAHEVEVAAPLPRPGTGGRKSVERPETAENTVTRVETSAETVTSERLLPALPVRPQNLSLAGRSTQPELPAAPEGRLNEAPERQPIGGRDETPQRLVETRLEAPAEAPRRLVETGSLAEVEAEISNTPSPEIRLSPRLRTDVRPATMGGKEPTSAPGEREATRGVPSPERGDERDEIVARDAVKPDAISSRIEARQASPVGEKAAQQPQAVKPEAGTGDVKITIGRIEVRANFQPQPEPPKRPEPRLTLDEYLRTQNRRER